MCFVMDGLRYCSASKYFDIKLCTRIPPILKDVFFRLTTVPGNGVVYINLNRPRVMASTLVRYKNTT